MIVIPRLLIDANKNCSTILDKYNMKYQCWMSDRRCSSGTVVWLCDKVVASVISTWSPDAVLGTWVSGSAPRFHPMIEKVSSCCQYVVKA